MVNTRLWQIALDTTVRLAGCPKGGIEAVDWRRSMSLPEAHSDEINVVYGGDDEVAFRAAVAGGHRPLEMSGGSAMIEAKNNQWGWPSVPGSPGYSHGSSYGWRASVPAGLVALHLSQPSAATAVAIILAIHAATAVVIAQNEEKERVRNAEREAERLEREERNRVARLARESCEAIVREWLRDHVPALAAAAAEGGSMVTLRELARDLILSDDSDDDSDDEKEEEA